MTKKTKFTQRLIFIRVLSVFLALVFWLYVSGEQRQLLGFERPLTFRAIPVSWRNLGEDMFITGMTENVSLTLQGMEYAFDGLTPADMEAYVDLQGKEEGHHDVKVEAVVPRGLTVVEIQPPKATVVLDELVTTQFNVTPLYRGRPGEGMIIDESDFRPREVFVRGPSRQLERLHRVVFTVDVEGQTSPLNQEVPLYAMDSRENIIEEISVAPQSVEVWVEFKHPRRDIPLEVNFKDQDERLRNYIVLPNSLTVEGPRDVLNEISTLLTAEIDLAQYTEDTALEVAPVFPENVQPVDRDTVEVRLFFED